MSDVQSESDPLQNSGLSIKRYRIEVVRPRSTTKVRAYRFDHYTPDGSQVWVESWRI